MAAAGAAVTHRLEHARVLRPHAREHVSGDAAVVREEGDLLLAAIADVLGHGPEAHAVAVEIEDFLTTHWDDSVLGLMDLLHARLQGSRGAAAGLCLVDSRTGLLRYTGTGNTVIRRFGADETRLLSRPGIVGGNRRSTREEQMTLAPGDVVLLYTDGVKDRFALDDYPQLLHEDADRVARTVVRRFGKAHDDAACIVLRCSR